MIITPPGRTWAEIDLDNIAHNYGEFRRITGNNVKIMCVVKANACEHGAAAVAKRLEKEGCGTFGVATLDEGLELRRAGIASYILLLNHVPTGRIGEALGNNLAMTVFSKEMAKLISDSASTANPQPPAANPQPSAATPQPETVKSTAPPPAKIHIKIDTGMTRIGFNPEDAAEAAKYISALPKIEVEGVYTHFSCADEYGTAYTEMQIGRFNEACAEIEAAGVPIKIKHASNSAAAIMYPQAHFDMVRVGISLYGCYPSEEVDKSRVALKPAKQLKSQIVRINEAGPGVSVSYGGKFTTERESRLATIPVGYADGVSRVLSGKLMVLVNGQEAPVVGRICMDQCVADVTDVAGDVKVSDEVVIYGRQKGASIPVERIAGQMGTINYEMLCMTARRVPRYYMENGEIIAMVNYLDP